MAKVVGVAIAVWGLTMIDPVRQLFVALTRLAAWVKEMGAIVKDSADVVSGIDGGLGEPVTTLNDLVSR